MSMRKDNGTHKSLPRWILSVTATLLITALAAGCAKPPWLLSAVLVGFSWKWIYNETFGLARPAPHRGPDPAA